MHLLQAARHHHPQALHLPQNLLGISCSLLVLVWSIVEQLKHRLEPHQEGLELLPTHRVADLLRLPHEEPTRLPCHPLLPPLIMDLRQPVSAHSDTHVHIPRHPGKCQCASSQYGTCAFVNRATCRYAKRPLASPPKWCSKQHSPTNVLGP